MIRYNAASQFKFLARFGLGNIRSMMFGLLLAVAGFSIILLAFMLRRRPAKVHKAMALYEKFCRKLGRKGLLRQPAETASDFARRARTAQPTLANSIDEITHIYIRIRYARKSYPSDMKKLATLVSQFSNH